MSMHLEQPVDAGVPPEQGYQPQNDALIQDPSTQTGRPKRQRFLPAAYRDFVPSQPNLSSTIPAYTRHGSIPPAPNSISSVPSSRSPSPNLPPEPTTSCTEPNTFGLFREYTEFPSYEPDNLVSLDEVCDAATFNIPPTTSRDFESGFGARKGTTTPDLDTGFPLSSSDSTNPYAPFPNASTYHMMKFAYDESNDNSFGLAGIQRVNDEIIQQPGFNPEDLLMQDGNEVQSRFHYPVPASHKNPEDRAPTVVIEDVIHRDLLDVMKEAYSSDASSEYHLRGFKQMWQRNDRPDPIRIHGEVYTSDAFLEMEKEVLSSPPEPGCNLERVVVPIMLYSDSTHLASFGTASVCPGYLWFGSQSKYARAKPSKFAAHHLVYFPLLPKHVDDEYTQQFGHAPTDAVKTHLKRELEHAVWKLLFTTDFLDAYVHGTIVEGSDGILRRLYPRIFTYSADYPEKVLLASIKNLGTHFCPRCTTEKKSASEMGTREDMARRESCRRVDTRNRRKMIERARKKFFKKGKGINSNSVDQALTESWTPTRNAFSEAFQDLGLNYFRLFVNDILHEVEVGTFKDLITHLIRMCHTMGKDTVQELNQRFRNVPTFGRGTIRRFVDNVSELKKMAARDFEDLLQCAPACFEGLFSKKSQEIDDLVQELLAHFATWHAYAKLRLHTDLTLATTELGHLLRKFAEKTTETFDTRLLPREVAARARRKTNNQSNTDTPRKLFNLNTYKFHALGDYPWTIRTFGTTDSYSTQLGELEHRRVKRLYIRTNKINFTFQIARHEQRRRVLKKLLHRKHATNNQGHATRSKASQPSLAFADSDPLPFTDPLSRYHISSSTRFPVNLTTWLGDLQDDLAFMNFLPKLKDHLLERILSLTQNENEFTEAERATITFMNNRIFRHKVIRLNYTTYDLRRNQDSCNPRTHSDIIMLSGDAETCADHPYWFARIIGIYHADIVYSGKHQKHLIPQRFDFLHVRWFGLAREQDRYGIHAKSMPAVGFMDAHDPEAFGFVNPSDIIRGCHVVPGFNHGTTTQFLPSSSLARQDSDDNKDYFRYYVNMWVDRDMFMRFRGGGVGHKSTLTATHVFEEQNTVGFGDLEEMYDNITVRPDPERGGDTDDEENSDDEIQREDGGIQVDSEAELGPEDGEDVGNGENFEGFAEY
ncbi:hypothetical protein F5880DRAFT_1618699 [Lentinula raphanica]|nr:hypothetical protein F5880DRAFT_1618699 [Lentinula raphanica]